MKGLFLASKNKNIAKPAVDMINGPLLGKMIKFAIPVALSSVLQLLFNAADTIVVGRFAGDNSLAAVGSTSSLINLLIGLFMGLSIGANVLVAQAYGSGNKKSISESVHTSLTLAFICGVFLTFLGITVARLCLTLMGSPAEILDLATLYLRVYFLGMPAQLVYNFGASILRAKGETKRPLYFLTASGIINVILNLILVIVFKMDVAGVAIATIVSQYVSATLVIIYLMNEEGELKFSFKNCCIKKAPLIKILRVGVPSGIQGMVFSLSNVVIQSAVNSFGNIVIAGNSAASNIEGFVYIAMNAMYQTALTFAGQNYGAGKHKRILKVMWLSQAMVFVTGLVLGSTIRFFGVDLLHLYSTSDEVVAAGMDRMNVIMPIYFLCGMMDSFVGVLRGIGKSVVPMICSIMGACVFRIVVIFTFFRFHHTTFVLYMLYPTSWIITMTAHIIYLTYCYKKMTSTRLTF